MLRHALPWGVILLVLVGKIQCQEQRVSPSMKPLLGGHMYWQIDRNFNTPDPSSDPSNPTSFRNVQFTLEVAFEEHPDCVYNTGESVKCPALQNGVADAHGVRMTLFLTTDEKQCH